MLTRNRVGIALLGAVGGLAALPFAAFASTSSVAVADAATTLQTEVEAGFYGALPTVIAVIAGLLTVSIVLGFAMRKIRGGAK